MQSLIDAAKKRLAILKSGKEQLVANLNATAGAIQETENYIAQLEEKAAKIAGSVESEIVGLEEAVAQKVRAVLEKIGLVEVPTQELKPSLPAAKPEEAPTQEPAASTGEAKGN